MGVLSLAAAGTFGLAWPAGDIGRRGGADGSALVQPTTVRAHRCPHASRPLALLLVQTRSADLDLEHYLDADRPGGFAARVMPFAGSDGHPLHTPNIDVAGDARTWHWVGVNLDRTAALALAYRLRELPAIADARVSHVVE